MRDSCSLSSGKFVLVGEYLPGREFTVGILGTGAKAAVLGTLEIILRRDAEPGVYSYVNKERCEELVEYRLVRPDDPQVRMAEETYVGQLSHVWEAVTLAPRPVPLRRDGCPAIHGGQSTGRDAFLALRLADAGDGRRRTAYVSC